MVRIISLPLLALCYLASNVFQPRGKGLVVDSVHEKPAIRAGLLEGDIIKKINGIPIDGPQTVLKLFAKVRPLDRMDFMV